MKTAILGFAILVSFRAVAQTNEPMAEDFKVSVLNQPSQKYPQVNS